MININFKENCTGCFACANICPQHCIQMSYDDEGFLYPKVDLNICVDCGLCEDSCPIIHAPSVGTEKPNAYAAINKNNSARFGSSSGAIFPLLADVVLKYGGTVFGAAFDDNYLVMHKGINAASEVSSLCSSKYVQSKIGNCYKEVSDLLNKDKLVLFVGTPCQIAGLKSYFQNTENNNLITVDFICHGVPSPKVWEKYMIECLGDACNIDTISFRFKKHGWKKIFFRCVYKNGRAEICESASKNAYIIGFLKNLFLRPSCYNCRFKTLNRVSDLTIADFWGINHVLPKLYDNKGCSLIITHTKIGVKLIEDIRENTIIESVDVLEAVKFNSAMLNSVVAHPNRNEFFKRYKNENFCCLINSLCKETTKELILSFIKRVRKRIKLMVRGVEL